MKCRFTSTHLVLTLGLLTSTAFASTTWYADGVNGNDNNNCMSPQTACKTIGHAISLASKGDTVMVAPATYTENLTINFSLKVIGSGASTTIIDGGQVNTVVTIPSASANVTLSKVTIQNGSSTFDGGGIYNEGALTVENSTISGNSAYYCYRYYCSGSGGGIYNGGKLTISKNTISGNSSAIGGGIYNGGKLTINKNTISGNSSAIGGGIENEGRLSISNSTISGNSALGCDPLGDGCGGSGGGIENDGGLTTINSSTISGNLGGGCGREMCGGTGGGIDNEDSGTLTINNSTLSGNSAGGCALEGCGGAGGGVENDTGLTTISNSTFSGNTTPVSGGAIENDSGTTTLQNSIVASSQGVGNCFGTMTSNGYNLSDDNTCNFNGPGDLNNTNPELGPLQNNGGPTQTMALPEGSPALDAGNPKGCTDGQGHLLKTDQRGKPRPGPHDHHGCDMGAYENQEY